MPSGIERERPDRDRSPLFWFVRFESARKDNDYEAAGEAIRRLRAMGIIVQVLPPSKDVAHAS